MDDLRTKIRDAFQNEQAAHGPAPTLGNEIRAAVAARPRRRPDYEWLAVAAAALIGLLVVAGLMSTRLAGRGVPAHPRATPTSGPQVDYGVPPAGVALIYVSDPTHPGWYNAFDWTGRPRGTIKLAAPLGDNLYFLQAPDGSGFITAAAKATAQQLFDRLGAPVTDSFSDQFQSQVWADDGKHLCTLDYNSGQWHVGFRSPGAAPTELHAVAIDPSVVQSGIIAIAFSSCSPSRDRAVLVYNYFGRPSQFWVVRLSDGAILSHQTFDPNVLANIVASPDSKLIAESSATSSGSLLGGAAPSTAIIRASDGGAVLNLDPSFGVIAFSQDNSVALVNTSPFASGVPTGLALVSLQTGSVIWRSSGPDELTAALAQPGGGAFALFLQDALNSTVHPSVHVLIVRADGTSVAVPGTYLQP
ncbi:MAG: hypothetical protein M3082_12365 [Candidatus Dormibacteraeota bacterium]|nr:hypothetical protein [Candidatus Dormibacteraeota bacterium]